MIRLECPHCGESVSIQHGEIRCPMCGYLMAVGTGPNLRVNYPGDPVPHDFETGCLLQAVTVALIALVGFVIALVGR